VAVEQDPHTIAIQKAIPAVNDRLRTMTGIIQNGQASHAQALGSLDLLTARVEQRIEGIADTLSEFIGGSFHFVPRSQLDPTAPPIIRASSLLNGPVAVPVTTLTQAVEVLRYRMSRAV
jgi:hypothetical protein